MKTINQQPTHNNTKTQSNTTSNTTLAHPEALLDYLQQWDHAYQQRAQQIPLFDLDRTANWSTEQRHRFVKLFYHARGHFYRFLWLLGNEAPNKKFKDLILANIAEEFGERARSHEQLYDYFAQAMGVNTIQQEYIHDTHHIPKLQQFNNGHLVWLSEHPWSLKWAAFSAYERLDNVDYINLLALARSLGMTGRGVAFFRVHQKANHFDQTYQALISIWRQTPEGVNKAFTFIQHHQLEMWRCLSDAVANS